MEGFSLNCIELQEYQPNRYPFLMIDHVEEVIPGVSAKGYKNLTLNEWYFPKHFPGAPNMPGALQLEALAQMNDRMLQVDFEFSQNVPYVLTDAVDPMKSPWLDG